MTREGSEAHLEWLKHNYEHLIEGVVEGEMEPAELAGQIADKIVGLETESIRDRMTGVFNRGLVGVMLGHELKQGLVGVIFLDVDKFKSINDEEPDKHEAGDRALIAAAEILMEVVDDIGVVGRWGGEEFIIVMPKVDEKGIWKLGVKIGQKIRDELAGRAKLERSKVTASLGVVLGRVGQNATEVIDMADKLLYKAKEGGRNRMVMVKNGKEVVEEFG